jgi:hypothetical protein
MRPHGGQRIFGIEAFFLPVVFASVDDQEFFGEIA